MLLKFFGFLFTFSLIYFLMHYYVYFRITRDFGLKANFLLRGILLMGAFLFLLGEFLVKRSSSLITKVFYFAGGIWFGIITTTVFLLLVSEIVRLFYRAGSFSITLTALSISGIVCIYSLFNTLRAPVLKKVEIEYKNLPSQLDGFKIVHLSDLHLNSAKSFKWLNGIVKRVNALSPDLICITGDLIDADILKSEEFHNVLKNLKATHGVFAVPGNHEIYAGMGIFQKVAEQSGIRILKNETVSLSDHLEIAGISWDFEDAEKIFPREKQKFRIFLSHAPEVFDKVFPSIDLQLSGHTHAGQIFPMELLIGLFSRYPYGLYKKEDAYIYTTSGTGLWGPPMRFLSKCEIVEVVLKGKNFI